MPNQFEADSPHVPTVASIQFDAASRARLEDLARAGYPLETCGLLLGSRAGDRIVIEEITQGRNLETARPAERYTLDPVHLMTTETRARAAGLEVVGVWHTHPDRPARPGTTDLRYAQDGWAYVIASVSRGGVTDVRSWALVNGDFTEQALP